MAPASEDPDRLPPLPADAARRTVVVPALDEAAAVPLLARLADEVLDRGIAGRVVVVDGGSSDDTVTTARAAGLEVLVAGERPPGLPVRGKGDSIWRVADLDADVLVFRDADVVGVGADDLDRLATAVEQPGVALAKGRFVRLQHRDGPPREVSGRITEFVARPLLGLLAPDVDLAEPLSGQFAVRGDVLATLPVVTRYGVDVGLALDVVARFGPAAVSSVDVGSLTHRSKDDASLVPMAHDVAATILGRRAQPVGTRDHLTAPDHHAIMAPDGAAADGAAADGVAADGVAADGAGTVDAVATVLSSAGPDGPLVVRPPRRAWLAHATAAPEDR